MPGVARSSQRAALICQHGTEESDHAIAAGLDVLIVRAKPKPAAPVAPAVGRASKCFAHAARKTGLVCRRRRDRNIF